MKRTLELHRDQRGLVGKVMIVWLLLVAVLAVGAVDAGSIAVTTFKLSSVATEAAIDGAAELRQGVGADEACEVVRATVEAMQANLKMGKKFCEVDLSTGEVSVTLRSTAGTVLIGRLSFTKHYATVVESQAQGPPDV